MIRDGIDDQPAERCGRHCGICTRYCSKTLADFELRAQGWKPIADAPLDVEIQGLTVNGNKILARYLAAGDYVDRWVHPYGERPLLDLTHFRSVQPRLVYIGH